MNIIALVVIALIAKLSKRNELPIIICFFYSCYLLIEFFEGFISGHVFYFSNVIIDVVVLIYCIWILKEGIAYVMTTFVFMVYVALFFAFPDLMMFLLHETAFEVSAELLYEGFMQPAVFVDILFAIIGSDNKISRMLFRDS